MFQDLADQGFLRVKCFAAMNVLILFCRHWKLARAVWFPATQCASWIP